MEGSSLECGRMCPATLSIHSRGTASDWRIACLQPWAGMSWTIGDEFGFVWPV